MHDMHAVDVLHFLDDLVEVGGVGRQHRDVAYLCAFLDPDDVDSAERSAGLADRGRQARERPRRVVEPVRSVALNDADGCIQRT